MSVHLALSQSDVLREIFGHLSPFHGVLNLIQSCHYPALPKNQTRALHRRTLANAALVCRAFAEPASEVLWTMLEDGLSALLATFMEHAPLTVPAGMDAHNMGFIPDSEWPRFLRLAHRVRCLVYNHSTVPPSLIIQLHSQNDCKPIFPALRYLVWPESCGNHDRELVLATICGTTTLSHFFLTQRHKTRFSDNFTADLDIIASERSTLQHLQIHPHAVLYPRGFFLSDRFRCLRTARFGGLDDAFLLDVSQLKHLENLHVNLMQWETVSRVQAATGFPALRRLTIDGDPAPSAVINIVSTISSPALASVTLHLHTHNLPEVDACAQALSNLPAAPSLRRVSLIVNCRLSSGGCRLATFTDIARPLLQLPDLKVFTLEVQDGVLNITDSEVQDMQRAWPRIVRLSVKSSQSGLARHVRAVNLPSLPALAALALACRELVVLDIPPKHTLPQELGFLVQFTQALNGLCPQTKLRRLTAVTFDLSTARKFVSMQIRVAEVAQLLSVLKQAFPGLEAIDTRSGRQRPGDERR